MSTIVLLQGTIIDTSPETLNTMVFQFFNVMAIIFALGFVLYKPVKNFMDIRTNRIIDQMDDAEAKQKEAAELKLLYEEKLRNIDVERNEILAIAHKRAIDQEIYILEQAKKEAELLRDRAKLELEREKEKAKEDMKSQIIEISSLMASRYVQTNIDDEAQNKLLNEVISDLGETTWLS